MEEDEQDADGTKETHTEQVDAEEAATQCSAISKLVLDNVAWHIPAQEQTGEEATHRQEYLTR